LDWGKDLRESELMSLKGWRWDGMWCCLD